MKKIKILWHNFWIGWHNFLTPLCMRFGLSELMLDQVEKMQCHCDKIWNLNEKKGFEEFKRMKEIGREEYERQQNEK